MEGRQSLCGRRRFRELENGSALEVGGVRGATGVPNKAAVIETRGKVGKIEGFQNIGRPEPRKSSHELDITSDRLDYTVDVRSAMQMQVSDDPQKLEGLYLLDAGPIESDVEG